MVYDRLVIEERSVQVPAGVNALDTSNVGTITAISTIGVTILRVSVSVAIVCIALVLAIMVPVREPLRNRKV